MDIFDIRFRQQLRKSRIVRSNQNRNWLQTYLTDKDHQLDIPRQLPPTCRIPHSYMVRSHLRLLLEDSGYLRIHYTW